MTIAPIPPSWWAVGVPLLAGGILAGVVVWALRTRRRARLLDGIGRKHSMQRTSPPYPESVCSRLGRFEGRDGGVRLSDVMVGEGESARTIFARRRIHGRTHHVVCLLSERPSHLDGFHARPVATPELEIPEFCLEWRAPRERWSDERSLSMAARAMHNLSTVADRGAGVPLALEISGRSLWICSGSALDGEDLERFVDDAMRLRVLLLKSLERANDVGARSGR